MAASQQLPVSTTVHALHVPLPQVSSRCIPLHPKGVVQALTVTVPPTMSAAVVLLRILTCLMGLMLASFLFCSGLTSEQQELFLHGTGGLV